MYRGVVVLLCRRTHVFQNLYDKIFLFYHIMPKTHQKENTTLYDGLFVCSPYKSECQAIHHTDLDNLVERNKYEFSNSYKTKHNTLMLPTNSNKLIHTY